MTITNRQHFTDVFDTFHDGSITAIECQKNDLLLTIEIAYLAERVNSKYKVFFLYLANAQTVDLVAWYQDDSKGSETFSDIEEIAGLELEILSSRLTGNDIVVACNLDSCQSKFGYGELKLKTDSLTILDESHRELSRNELEKLSGDYWQTFGEG